LQLARTRSTCVIRTLRILSLSFQQFRMSKTITSSFLPTSPQSSMRLSQCQSLSIKLTQSFLMHNPIRILTKECQFVSRRNSLGTCLSSTTSRRKLLSSSLRTKSAQQRQQTRNTRARTSSQLKSVSDLTTPRCSLLLSMYRSVI